MKYILLAFLLPFLLIGCKQQHHDRLTRIDAFISVESAGTEIPQSVLYKIDSLTAVISLSPNINVHDSFFTSDSCNIYSNEYHIIIVKIKPQTSTP